MCGMLPEKTDLTKDAKESFNMTRNNVIISPLSKDSLSTKEDTLKSF